MGRGLSSRAADFSGAFICEGFDSLAALGVDGSGIVDSAFGGRVGCRKLKKSSCSELASHGRSSPGMAMTRACSCRHRSSLPQVGAARASSSSAMIEVGALAGVSAPVGFDIFSP